MKKRVLIVLLVVILLVLGIKTITDKKNDNDEAYNNAMKAAEEDIKNGLYGDAYVNFLKALQCRESKELRCKMIESLAYVEEFKAVENEMDAFLEKYPQDPEPYEYLCLYSAHINDISEIYKYADTMKKRGIKSDIVDELCEKHKYDYNEKTSKFVEVDPFYYGHSRVKSKSGLYGYINTGGDVVIEPQYDLAVADTGVGYLLVSKNQYEKNVSFELIDRVEKANVFTDTASSEVKFGTFFVDYNGAKKIVDKQRRGMIFDDIQGYGSGMMAVCENGMYRYVDSNFDTVDDEKKYLFAGVFHQGVAPVMTSSGWMIIDEKQNRAGNDYFEKIRLNEANIAVNDGVFFGLNSNGWGLYSSDGTQITQDSYEDCCCANGSKEPIAVKKAGKWGFINASGETVLDFQYDGARSFSNGVAAVEVDGLWGMITPENKMIVEPQYLMAYDLTSNGVIPVETKAGWTLLEFYSMHK